MQGRVERLRGSSCRSPRVLVPLLPRVRRQEKCSSAREGTVDSRSLRSRTSPFNIRFCPSPLAPLCPSQPLFRCKCDRNVQTGSENGLPLCPPPPVADQASCCKVARQYQRATLELYHCQSRASLCSVVSDTPPVWPSDGRQEGRLQEGNRMSSDDTSSSSSHLRFLLHWASD